MDSSAAWIFSGLLDPFTLLALLVFVLAMTVALATRTSGLNFKGIPVFAISAFASVAALVGATLNTAGISAVRSTAAPPIREPATLQVIFDGKQVTVERATIPFRISSGQINVGCNESRSTQAQLIAPPNATNIVANAHWENFNNVRSQNASAPIQGTTITATGQISGLAREWTGNCPGGGHGELILSGTYDIQRPVEGAVTMLSSFQSFVEPKSLVSVPVPEVPSSIQNPRVSVQVTLPGQTKPLVRRFLLVAGSSTALELRDEPDANTSEAQNLTVEAVGSTLRIQLP
jgi:hypothetical protein